MASLSASCPVCETSLGLVSPRLHEVLECPTCGVRLEVSSLSPLVLEELPEVKEDWGE